MIQTNYDERGIEVNRTIPEQGRTSFNPSVKRSKYTVNICVCKIWHGRSHVGVKGYRVKGGSYTVTYVPRDEHNKKAGR